MENFNFKIYFEKTKDLRDVLTPDDEAPKVLEAKGFSKEFKRYKK